MTAATRLERSLCHELAQAERSARVHPQREALRLGNVPPARALLAITEHAVSLERRVDALLTKRIHPRSLGEVMGEGFSIVRHLVVDRVLSTQQSYRFTLIGVAHGVDVAHLVRSVAQTINDRELAAFCDELLRERVPLLEAARAALDWFAAEPEEAQMSGLRRLFHRRTLGLASERERTV